MKIFRKMQVRNEQSEQFIERLMHLCRGYHVKLECTCDEGNENRLIVTFPDSKPLEIFFSGSYEPHVRTYCYELLIDEVVRINADFHRKKTHYDMVNNMGFDYREYVPEGYGDILRMILLQLHGFLGFQSAFIDSLIRDLDLEPIFATDEEIEAMQEIICAYGTSERSTNDLSRVDSGQRPSSIHLLTMKCIIFGDRTMNFLTWKREDGDELEAAIYDYWFHEMMHLPWE